MAKQMIVALLVVAAMALVNAQLGGLPTSGGMGGVPPGGINPIPQQPVSPLGGLPMWYLYSRMFDNPFFAYLLSQGGMGGGMGGGLGFNPLMLGLFGGW